MKTLRRVVSVLGLKGILSLFFMATVAVALVTYTADITVTPTQQFSSGAASASWTIYVNDVDEARYLPGSGSPAGSSQPTFDSGDSSTYAFKVVTDSARVCAIKLELTSQVDNSKFSKFQVTALRWNSVSSTWDSETLYAGATGSTTKSYVDGLTPGDVAYIHQSAGSTEYYAVKVVYSYDLVDTTTQITVTVQYTPLPQSSF